MSKIAIIGASYLQLPLVSRAKELGHEVFCFAWDKDAVCKDVADHFFPISITEKEEILKECKAIGIDGICTIASDVAAPTVAYVAERMKLNANSYASACRANNKYEMLNALSAAGVPCPRYEMVTSTSDINIDLWTYPLIVKPSDRSGSLGVAKVENRKDLISAVENAISLSFKGEAIIEEFIEGREISVEFISYHGKHYPLQITDKVTTESPHFVELEHHQPANFPEEKFNEIYSLTEKSLKALGLTEGASHSEFRITAEGKIVVMEIGGRMGGDFIGSDLVKLSTGYDFVEGVIQVALNEFKTPIKSQDYHSGVYFLCKETESLLPIFSNPSKFSEIVVIERTDTELRNVKCSADRSGYFIYQDSKRFKI